LLYGRHDSSSGISSQVKDESAQAAELTAMSALQQQASAHVGMSHALNEDGQVYGRPGYVPKWVLEWIPRAQSSSSSDC
jgi:hypothetical protein